LRAGFTMGGAGSVGRSSADDRWRRRGLVSLASARGPLDREEWRQLREPLENAVLRFVNLAREELGGLGPPLPRLNGRPAPDDPAWPAGVSP
jgi:hypothetical protein